MGELVGHAKKSHKTSTKIVGFYLHRTMIWVGNNQFDTQIFRFPSLQWRARRGATSANNIGTKVSKIVSKNTCSLGPVGFGSGPPSLYSLPKIHNARQTTWFFWVLLISGAAFCIWGWRTLSGVPFQFSIFHFYWHWCGQSIIDLPNASGRKGSFFKNHFRNRDL